MNFGFTEEQNLLRDQVARFMQQACPMSKVRELMTSDDGFDAALWRQAAELGWLGRIIPEQHGGVGLRWIDLTVEELDLWVDLNVKKGTSKVRTAKPGT